MPFSRNVCRIYFSEKYHLTFLGEGEPHNFIIQDISFHTLECLIDTTRFLLNKWEFIVLRYQPRK